VKRYTSRFLKSVAIFYLGFPVFHLLLSALLFDIPASGCVGILLSPSYYLLSLVAMAVGYALWEVHRWGWYLFVFTNFLIAYQNAVFVNEYGTTHHKFLAFFSSILILLVFSFRVAREIRVPYFFPRIRWWESNPRYKLSIPVKITVPGSTPLEGQIMDLSMVGCFVRLPSEMTTHDWVNLDFAAFEVPISCRGVIVWKTQSTVTMPKGIGVKFSSMPRQQKRALKGICQQLKKIANFYTSSRYLLNQEEFQQRLSELESRIDWRASKSRRKRLLG
jgi:hypothetical protein